MGSLSSVFCAQATHTSNPSTQQASAADPEFQANTPQLQGQLSYAGRSCLKTNKLTNEKQKQTKAGEIAKPLKCCHEDPSSTPTSHVIKARFSGVCL